MIEAALEAIDDELSYGFGCAGPKDLDLELKPEGVSGDMGSLNKVSALYRKIDGLLPLVLGAGC